MSKSTSVSTHANLHDSTSSHLNSNPIIQELLSKAKNCIKSAQFSSAQKYLNLASLISPVKPLEELQISVLFFSSDAALKNERRLFYFATKILSNFEKTSDIIDEKNTKIVVATLFKYTAVLHRNCLFVREFYFIKKIKEIIESVADVRRGSRPRRTC